MPKKITGFVIAAAILLLLAALAYTNLEIRPRTVYIPPSREALVNNFFALETWLARTGHPARFEKRGGPAQITGAPEKAVFLQASVFDWEGAAEPLKNWIAAGGFLLVSLEPPFGEDPALDAFLSGFGIGVENPAAGEDAAAGEEDRGGEGAGETEAPPPEGVPDFDLTLQFTVSTSQEPASRGRQADGVWPLRSESKEKAPAVFTVTEGGIIRLAGISLGAGAVVFIGQPRFMENAYLDREVNARLAWDLTGGRTGGGNPGLLFIRGRRQAKSLFGKLADRGNLLPLGLSLFILILAGFWMVIPPFGLLLQEKKSSGRPIRERFLAEIRFLKKYHALETYLQVYIHEIKRKLRGRDGTLPDEIARTLKTKGRLPYKELIRNLQKLEAMMERL